MMISCHSLKLSTILAEKHPIITYKVQSSVESECLHYIINIRHGNKEDLQLDLTVSIANNKSSNLAPVTSFTISPSFKILKVGTTLIPSSFANGCQQQSKQETGSQNMCLCKAYILFSPSASI